MRPVRSSRAVDVSRGSQGRNAWLALLVVGATVATASAAPFAFAQSSVEGCGYGSFGVGNWPEACWRPYADSSPFNQELTASARVDPNSAAIVDRLLGFGPLQHIGAGNAGGDNDWGHPTFWSQPSDPLVTVHCAEPWGTCAVEGDQVRIPTGATPAAGGFTGDDSYDNHMTVVDQTTNTEYDFWHAEKPADGSINIGWGGKTRIDGDGRGSDAVAAQYGTMAGKIRAEELAAGQINHALFMTVKCDSGRAVYPATKGGLPCSAIGLSDTNAPNEGTRFQLNLTDTQIDALPVPTWKKAILRAMARYGMYVGDTGGTWGIKQEGGTTYTSFGYPDKWLSISQLLAGVMFFPDNTYMLNLRDDVDWARDLRVIEPCVAEGTC
jgi:hypothetical protein